MPYTRVTRAELRAQLADKWESVPFWDDDDANHALNAALRLWNALTGYWRARIVVTGAPDDPLVFIPGTLVQRTTLTYQGRPMVQGSLHELSYLSPNWWHERTGDGGTVPTRPTIWAPIGLSLIAVWPATPGNAAYEVDGIRTTPVLLTDDQFVDLGDEEFSTLLGYALHVASFKAGAVLVERTRPYHVAFMAAAGKRNGRLLGSNWWRQFEKQNRDRMLRPPSVPPEPPLVETQG